MKRLLIVNIVLLAIVVVLAAQIASLWWRGQPAVDPVVPKAAKPPKADVRNAPRRPPAPDIAEKIAAKDLFDPTRAPATAESVAATEEPVRPLTLALMGVMVAAGERQVLVKDQTQPKPIWLREGEQIGGYSVARIDPEAVVMTAPNGDETRLMINVEKHAGAVPATGPAGIQPPATVVIRPGVPSPAATPVRPRRAGAAGTDIKEKIERLREEARRRRGQPEQPAPPGQPPS
jgi:hypothetical protein